VDHLPEEWSLGELESILDQWSYEKAQQAQLEQPLLVSVPLHESVLQAPLHEFVLQVPLHESVPQVPLHESVLKVPLLQARVGDTHDHHDPPPPPQVWTP